MCKEDSLYKAVSSKGQDITAQFLEDDTDRLISVEYCGGTAAVLKMFSKTADTSGVQSWEEILSCEAFVGRDGIGKVREGDYRTPVGVFPITEGFGLKENPGLDGLKYTQVEWYHYWSEEPDTYNTLIDVRDLGRTSMKGEHLQEYEQQYRYALNIGYNAENVFGMGSAIFLHCTGSKTYTAGCVAVPEEVMRRIMLHTTSRTRICIYPQGGTVLPEAEL